MKIITKLVDQLSVKENLQNKALPALAAALIVVAALVPTHAAIAGGTGTPSVDEPSVPDGPTSTELDTALPPVPADLMSWASETQESLQVADAFSTVRLNDERTGAEIYWHGEITADLQQTLDAASTTYDVDVTQTAYKPGALRAAASALLEQRSLNGSVVTATWANPDGSGISAAVEAGTAERRSAVTPEFEGFPLTVAIEELTPAVGRQNDNYHFGGSRLINTTTSTSCSLGFAVALPNSPSTNGGMFASHCTGINHKWVRPTDVSGQYYSMGTATAEVNDRDGAILTGTFFSPGVYVGSYTSDAFVYITGVANPVQNTEICYSGSYSGTVCGNLVSVPNYNYNLTGVGAVSGVMTAQTQGYPAAGNGDSGGPGIVPVSAPGGGVYLWAGTIISAIPTLNKTANCQGVPGSGPDNSTNPADRQCSHIVISTKASEIASTAGWLIRVVNP